MPYVFDLYLKSVCLPDYLQDHHNRDGECLLGIPVCSSTTLEQAKEALTDELNSCTQIPEDELSDAEFGALFDGIIPDEKTWQHCLRYLEDENEEELEHGDSVYAYFVLSWDFDEEDYDETEDDHAGENPEVEAANNRSARYGGDYWQNDAGEYCCG